MPDLEERVAALEELARFPLRTVRFQPMSDEDAAKFREDFEAAARQPVRILPQLPPLAPDEIRQFLSECVTAVRPGETLVVRVPWTTTPTQLREYQRVMDSAEGGEIPFRVLVVAGDELGTVQPEPDFMDRTRIEPLDAPGDRAVRLFHEPTGIAVAARDRAEGIRKLRKALAGHARRQNDLQEQARRQASREQRESGGAPGAA